MRERKGWEVWLDEMCYIVPGLLNMTGTRAV